MNSNDEKNNRNGAAAIKSKVIDYEVLRRFTYKFLIMLTLIMGITSLALPILLLWLASVLYWAWQDPGLQLPDI